MPRINTQHFYNAALKKYGQTPQALHWNSQESQIIRYEIITQLLPQTLHPFTLVDVGCGFGDLYHFLKKHNKTPKKYIGIDVLDSMCAIATRNTQQEIYQADATYAKLLRADYYVCSGAMNTLTKFESYQFIRNCFLHAKKGFIFNTLYGTKESSTYNYLNYQDIQTLANNLGVNKVTRRQNYLDNDITIRFEK